VIGSDGRSFSFILFGFLLLAVMAIFVGTASLRYKRPAVARILFCVQGALIGAVAGATVLGLLSGMVAIAMTKDGFASVGWSVLGGAVGLLAGAPFGWRWIWQRTRRLGEMAQQVRPDS
jgi:hypothetical protein